MPLRSSPTLPEQGEDFLQEKEKVLAELCSKR